MANPKNCILLYKEGIFEYLFGYLPKSFVTICEILDIINDSDEEELRKCANWFITIGGIYFLTLFSDNPEFCEIISRIFLLISVCTIPFTNEIPEPCSDLREINFSIPYKTLQITELLDNISNSEKLIASQNLYFALSNIFQSNQKFTKRLGYFVLQKFPELIETELCIPALTACNACIEYADCDDPLHFIHLLPDLLSSEDALIVTTSLELAEKLVGRCGLDSFYGSPAVEAIVALCTESPFNVKPKAVSALFALMAASDEESSSYLISLGVIEFVCEYLDSAPNDDLVTILDDFGEFLSKCGSDPPEDFLPEIAEGVEKVMQMTDHDISAVAFKAHDVYETLSVIIDEVEPS